MQKIINKEYKPLRDSLGLATMLENEREDMGIVTQQVEVFLECFVAKFEQHFPFYWREYEKKNKLLLAGNAAKHTKMSENFCFYAEIFWIKISASIIID
jgi:hypothetical protein